MAKKRKLQQPAHGARAVKRSNAPPSSKKSNGASPSSKHATNSRTGGGSNSSNSSSSKPTGRPQEPIIPFSPEDRILLVGEGDLSFAASLVEHHYCENLTATVLEKDVEELTAKYPHVGENIAKIEAEGFQVLCGVDARKLGPFTNKKGKDGVGNMDRIIFNFPHVGGKSTDVNRQVRYNQELLVEFFKQALLSLAPGGSIIVTLFEGEPYTLWNIRDLGRHSGLQVERSFKFQASAYPGYHHARTLGAIRNKDGEIQGGWKGEDRDARSYIFVRKDDVPKPVPSKKRKKAEDDDSSDDEG